jgi:glycosyltransferase involved in cell wall biosynthesis/Flp pilus assembly protein TadD
MSLTENRRIFFACMTEFHVLVAFILSKTVYETDQKTLFLASTRAANFEANAQATGVWDEVRLIEHTTVDVLNDVVTNKEDVLHFFTYGAPAYNRFFVDFSAQGGKICLTDEGLLTYRPAKSLANWLLQNPANARLAEGFTIDAINEYWLIQPKAFCEKTHASIREIPLATFIEQAKSDPVLVRSLSNLCGALEQPLVSDKDAVYFQQPMALVKQLPRVIDQVIDAVVIRAIAPLNSYIKTHPALTSQGVSQTSSAEFVWLDRVPWEVNLLLNHIQGDSSAKVFISLNSSALHNSMWFHPDGVFIYLYRIMDAYAGKKEYALDDFVDRLVKAYPNAKIYRPRHWGELHQVLSEVGRRVKCTFNLSGLPFTAKSKNAAAPTGSASVALRKLKQAVERKDWVSVESGSKALLARKPDHAEAAFYLALALIGTGRASAGRHLLHQILAAHPERIMVARAVIDADFEASDFDSVINISSSLMPYLPDDLGLRKRLAIALQHKKASEDAFWVNETIHRLDPSENEAISILLSQGLHMPSLASRALVYAEKIRQRTPHDPEVLLKCAILHMNQRGFKSAESTFREALKYATNTTRFDAQNGLALSLFNLGQLNESLEIFKQLVRQAPEFTAALPGFAQALKATDRYEESISNLPAPVAEQIKTILSQQPGMPYSLWIETVENFTQPLVTSIQSELAQWSSPPLITVLLPTFNSDPIFLAACIESVLQQSYPHWELCIADDASTQASVRQVLDSFAQKDSRIKIVYREQNGHISCASNSALELATGDYVALLDHDDALAEHALYFMAAAIRDHKDAQILYSDEDKIDVHGKRYAPHFKSDWNPDLFFVQNYVSHLGVYQRALLNQIGGFRTGLEGSQDQDLLLRCLPHVTAEQIIHLPRILYHWRAIEGSTAISPEEKSYTTDTGIKALTDYFENNGPDGIKIEAGMLPNTYRVRWPIPNPVPLVSLLIPTRDRKNLTEVAVRSILDKTTYPNYEIIILDNGSTEQETLDWFDVIRQEDQRVKILRHDHPFNYSAINNFGVQHAKGSLIGLINDDVEVISPDWLTEMVSHACREDIGCVGAKLYYSNDTVQHGGVIVGLGGFAAHSHKSYPREHPGYFARLKLVQNLSAVTAACLIVRKTVFNEVGGLDEANLKIAFNDVDFCLKVQKAGYRNLWTPYAELYHHESLSRGHEDTPEKQQRFRAEIGFMQAKWGRALARDPYYNPNLTHAREDFSIGSVTERPELRAEKHKFNKLGIK